MNIMLVISNRADTEIGIETSLGATPLEDSAADSYLRRHLIVC